MLCLFCFLGPGSIQKQFGTLVERQVILKMSKPLSVLLQLVGLVWVVWAAEMQPEEVAEVREWLG